VIASEITELNYQKMKDMGMKKIIFSKENTLCEIGDTDFMSEEIRASFFDCVKVFGEENVWILS